jgi:hypothetical protein
MEISSKLRNKLMLICMLIIYRIILDISYKDVENIYGHQGLFKLSRSEFSFILSWLLFICFIPFILRQFEGKHLSNYSFVFLALFSLIPQIVSISYRSDYPLEYIILMAVYWLLLTQLHHYIPPIHLRFNPSRIIQKMPDLILISLLVTVVIYSYQTTGLRFHFDIYNVYDIRAEARDYGFIFPFNYLLSFADSALAFFAVLLIHRGRYIYFGITLLVIFINFSITGTKGILFILIFGLLGYYFIRNPKHLIRIMIAVVALSFLALVEVRLIDTFVLTFTFFYRMLFLPVEMHYTYFTFFQINEYDIYRQSFLKLFFDSPYQQNIQFLIGEYAINDITARANNGLFSDAYMNLGCVGIFIHPFVIVILLRFFDGAACRIDFKIWPVIALYISIILISIPFSTALFTSGFIFFIILMYTFSKKNVQNSFR